MNLLRHMLLVFNFSVFTFAFAGLLELELFWQFCKRVPKLFRFCFKNKASKNFFFQKPIVLIKVNSLLTGFRCELIE